MKNAHLLCCPQLRRCDVPWLRLVPQLSGALHLGVFDQPVYILPSGQSYTFFEQIDLLGAAGIFALLAEHVDQAQLASYRQNRSDIVQVTFGFALHQQEVSIIQANWPSPRSRIRATL
jgi:hypothetical protein